MMTREEFEMLQEKWELQPSGREECPMCSNWMMNYCNERVEGVEVQFCHNCHEGSVNINVEPASSHICWSCNLLIRSCEEDRGEEAIVECSDELCERRAHRECLWSDMCETCRVLVCDDHLCNYTECDHCGEFHEEDCIISRDDEFVEINGIICKNCYYRAEEIVESVEALAGSAANPHISERIAENRDFYIKEARENFDLTIAVTHLVKGEHPFETLQSILRQKKICAAKTGYFGHTLGTKAVCFADLTTRGLRRHSERYSAFGLAFLKEVVYTRGGGPALYVRENLLKEGGEWPDSATPFVNKINLRSYDFHHEREWRVPGDFDFHYEEVAALYAPIKYHHELRRQFPEIPWLLDLDILLMI